MVYSNWRELVAISVFLICFSLSVVEAFAFLSDTTVPMSIHILAVLFSVFMYIVFALASATIKVFAAK